MYTFVKTEFLQPINYYIVARLQAEMWSNDWCTKIGTWQQNAFIDRFLLYMWHNVSFQTKTSFVIENGHHCNLVNFKLRTLWWHLMCCRLTQWKQISWPKLPLPRNSLEISTAKIDDRCTTGRLEIEIAVTWENLLNES